MVAHSCQSSILDTQLSNFTSMSPYLADMGFFYFSFGYLPCFLFSSSSFKTLFLSWTSWVRICQPKAHFFYGSITNSKLNGPNYLLWFRAVKVFLKACGKISHTWLSKPIDAKLIDTWEEADAQVMHGFGIAQNQRNLIVPPISVMLGIFGIHLTNTYSSTKNIYHIYKFYQNLFSCQQGNRLAQYTTQN